jgi:hypothetical protein
MLQGLFQAQQGDAAFVLEEVAHGGGPKVRSRTGGAARRRARTGAAAPRNENGCGCAAQNENEVENEVEVGVEDGRGFP